MMSISSKFYILFVFVIILNYAVSQECKAEIKPVTMEKQLHNKILCNYNKDLRPVKNYNNTINATLQMVVQNLHNAYQMSQTNSIHLTLVLTMVWPDEFLRWDPKDYGNITELYMSSSNIWIPPFCVLNSEVTTMANFVTPCVVQSSGYVHCTDKFLYQAICMKDFTKWPYDSSNCSVTFGTLVYARAHVNIHLNHSKVTINRPLASKFWDLESAEFIQDERNYPMARPTFDVLFVIKRKEDRHINVLLFPFIGMLAVGISSVFLDIVSLKRTLFNLLNILYHFIHIQHVVYLIPSMSDSLPYAVAYFRDSYVLSWILLMFDVFARNMVRKRQEVPKWIDSFIRLMDSRVGRVIMFPGLKPATVYSTYSTMAETDGDLPADKIDSSPNAVWIRFAWILNRLFLIIVLFTYAILLSKFLIVSD